MVFHQCGKANLGLKGEDDEVWEAGAEKGAEVCWEVGKGDTSLSASPVTSQHAGMAWKMGGVGGGISLFLAHFLQWSHSLQNKCLSPISPSDLSWDATDQPHTLAGSSPLSVSANVHCGKGFMTLRRGVWKGWDFVSEWVKASSP